MKAWKAILIYFAAFMVQGTLANAIAIFGSAPNILLVVTIIVAYFNHDKPYAIVLGALFGVLYDICYSVVIGPTGILLVIAAFIYFKNEGFANFQQLFSYMIIQAAVIAMFYVGYWILSNIAGIHTAFAYMLKHSAIGAVYTYAVALVVYLICVHFMRKKELKKG